MIDLINAKCLLRKMPSAQNTFCGAKRQTKIPLQATPYFRLPGFCI